jgi:hydroxypyruvate isomerase
VLDGVFFDQMPKLRQSVCWWCFERVLEPEDFARGIAEIGFEGVELVPEEHFSLMKSHGLQIVTHRGQSSLERGWNDKANHDDLEREFLEHLKTAETWKIPVLIVFSGNRYGVRDDTGARITAEGLSRVVGPARDAGVTIALEMLNSRLDHPAYMADRTDWALSVCEMVESSSLRLLYDAYHMQIMEGDVLRTINQWGAMFTHYHVAGNPGRHEPDAQQELNYPAIARSIAQWGNSSFVGHEWIPTKNPLKGLEDAFQIFDIEV